MLELTFITSSNIKLNHANHLCKSYEVRIVGYKKKYYGKGYEEPRIHERDELLKQSIEDALKRWKKNISRPDEKFFFIEDTSVIIHALSHDGIEVPGVDIKYWMQRNNFSTLDQSLKINNNDRRVTVRSDILLMLTTSLRKSGKEPFIRFTSKMDGTIAEQEYDIETNPIYPWLDNQTFNKWFIPDGCNIPISMLNISEADKYDFRAGAFRDMLDFLVDNKQTQSKKYESFPSVAVPGVLPIGPPLFLVSGPTCAGKTTLAEYLSEYYAYYHIEASDFMYLNYYNRLGLGKSISISDFAKQALIENPSIVVDEILNFISSNQFGPIIITGFRTTFEIDTFQNKFKGSYPIEILIIDSNETERLERYLNRNRSGLATRESFYRDSKIQNDMGLLSLIKKYQGNTLFNNTNLTEFYNNFVERYKENLSNEMKLTLHTIKEIKPPALQEAILISMYMDNANYLTTTEIAKLINKTFITMRIEKNKNNVSRYFNQSFYPYFEAKQEKNVNKYRLSQTGFMHAKWLLRKKYPIYL